MDGGTSAIIPRVILTTVATVSFSVNSTASCINRLIVPNTAAGCVVLVVVVNVVVVNVLVDVVVVVEVISCHLPFT